MGSANLNDRSMLGSRDSELAVFIEGPPDTPINSGFDVMMVNNKIHDFRRRLFYEHFGEDIIYPADPQYWNKMWDIAKTNSSIYNNVFKVYPSDLYPTFQSLADRNKDIDTEKFLKDIKKIRGFAVLYPFEFLKDGGLLENKNSELSLLAVPITALY